MKKRAFHTRKIKILLFHMVVLGVITLCFFKFPEEAIELKNELKIILHPELQDSKIDFSEYPAIEHAGDEWYHSEPLIYHAGGAVDGLSYTNSRESLEGTLEKGHRFVEIDFLYTSDQKLVCCHYWESLWEEEEAPSLSEFEKLPIFGKYTSMTAEDLIDYMAEYPDLHIIIDTKEENYMRVIEDLVLLSSFDTNVTDRFIVQLYGAGEKAKIQEIYPFENENFLLTTYKFNTEHTNKIMNICYEESISVIAIPQGSWSPEIIESFCSKNFVLYEYTVNRPNVAHRSLDVGVHGFYTDILEESDLKLK